MICGFCHRELDKEIQLNPETKQEELMDVYETVPDINIAENQVNSIACLPCASLVMRMVDYRNKFNEAKNSNDRMKHELNLFRSINLRPNTMQAIADEPTTPQPSAVDIRRRVAGLEVLDLNAILFWMETYELYAKELAQVAGRKASKDEIKAKLEENTKKAIQRQAKAEAETKERVKKESNSGLLGTYTSAEKKVIQGIMKTLRLSEDKALDHCHTMGMLTNITLEKKG